MGARRLRESEARLKLATEVAKLGVFVWDTVEDSASWENDRMYEIFGRTREQGPVNGAAFINEVVHPDYRMRSGKPCEHTLQKGEPFRFEGLMYRLTALFDASRSTEIFNPRRMAHQAESSAQSAMLRKFARRSGAARECEASWRTRSYRRILGRCDREQRPERHHHQLERLLPHGSSATPRKRSSGLRFSG